MANITTRPKPYVFVLMPFSKEFEDIYKLGIKPACERAGAYADRVDEQIFYESILQRIYNQISKADIVVAEFTGRNPNVFYETGYAHALGKKVIMLTQKVEHIPFDLKHYPHIIYDGRIAFLLEELEKRVRWYIDNPEESSESEYDPLEYRINEIPLKDSNIIICPIGGEASGFNLKVEIHNSAERDIKTVSYKIGIISPNIIIRCTFRYNQYDLIPMANNKMLFISNEKTEILPGAWNVYDLSFLIGKTVISPGMTQEMILRIFKHSGYNDFPFTVYFS